MCLGCDWSPTWPQVTVFATAKTRGGRYNIWLEAGFNASLGLQCPETMEIGTRAGFETGFRGRALRASRHEIGVKTA